MPRMYRSSRLCKSSIFCSSSYIQVKQCGFHPYLDDCSRCSRLGIECHPYREQSCPPPDSALAYQLRFCTPQDKERFLSHIGGQLLLWASEEGHSSLVELLLEVGINVNFKDSDKRTSLDYAMSGKRSQAAVLKILLQAGASVTAVDPFQKETPLHRAAKRFGAGYRSAIVLLLEANADVDAVDENGNTPLHLAAKFGPVETVEELIAANANLEKADSQGCTALHLAADSYVREYVVEKLLSAGCNSLARDLRGEIALDLALHRVEPLAQLRREKYLTTLTMLLRDWQMRLKLPKAGVYFERYSFDEMKQYYITNGGGSGGTV
jgi:hypothetical protein